RGSGLVYRFTNRLISAATTDVTAHGAVDFGVGRFGFVGEKGGGAHDLSGLAIAALRNVGVEPGFLNGMAAVRGESFDCRHALVRDVRDRRAAGARRVPIDVNRARSTESHAATELRSGHAERVAQYPQQRHLRLDVDSLTLAIYGKRNRC